VVGDVVALAGTLLCPLVVGPGATEVELDVIQPTRTLEQRIEPLRTEVVSDVQDRRPVRFARWFLGDRLGAQTDPSRLHLVEEAVLSVDVNDVLTRRSHNVGLADERLLLTPVRATWRRRVFTDDEFVVGCRPLPE